MLCSGAIHFIPFRQRIAPNLELGWQSANPRDSPQAFLHTKLFFGGGHWGLGFRFSVVHVKQVLPPTKPSPSFFL